MEALVSAAREYLTAGLSVIALSGKLPNGKFHPHWNADFLHGRPESADDEVLLLQIFEHSTTTGIGIVIPAPLLVVDIDGEEGAENLRNILGTAVLPYTPVAQTGRGMHVWFMSAQARRNTKLAPKLDIKGEGGYVAAPPSRHPDGAIYEWLEPLVDGGVLQEVQFLPTEIEERLNAATAIKDIPVRRVGPRDIRPLFRTVRDADEGTRNGALFWAACAARSDGFSLDEAQTELGRAASEAGLTALEARRTIRSAYER